MFPQYWSWLLTVVGVFGLWTAGSKKSWGWLVGLGAQDTEGDGVDGVAELQRGNG